MTDGEEDSSRDGWMDDGGKVDLGITLCGIGMNTNGSMLSHSPQDKDLFCRLTWPSDEVTHHFYKSLYTNIIRDIDVSS